jgi:iron complex outermembrane receptor protein
VNAPDLNNNGIKDQSEISQFISFRPETVTSYELGYKGSPLPGLDVATALFHADYKDVQIPGSAPCTLNGMASFCGVTGNAGKARFQGVELEADARLGRDLAAPGDRLNLAGTMGYIKADYLRYETFILAGRTTVDVADFRQVQNTPKWTASGTLDYSAPLSGGRLNLNTTLSYRSKTFQFEIPNPFLDQKAYSLLDANVLWKSSRFSVGVHGKNLLNERYRTSGYTFLAADPVTGALLRNATTGNFISGLGREGTLTTFWGNPRQVWLSFGVNF